jgi:SMI1 / KNR4 family (SUKH-1)
LGGADGWNFEQSHSGDSHWLGLRKLTARPDLDRLPGLLDELARLLDAMDAPNIGLLAPGTSEDQIRAAWEELDLDPPPESIIWWQWHNGIDSAKRHLARWSSDLEVAGFEQLSLQDAVAEYVFERRAAEDAQQAVDEPVTEDFWARSWLPLGKDNGGRVLALDTSLAPHEPCPVHFVEGWDETRATPKQPSLAALIEGRIRIYQERWEWRDAAGWHDRWAEASPEQRQWLKRLGG